MISTLLAAFSGLSTLYRLVTVGLVALPLVAFAIWGYGAWQYHQGRVFERAAVAAAAKRDAQQWADWLVQMAVDDEAFATALERARLADKETEKGIIDAAAKMPSTGVCLSADFLRELDKLRP